MQIREKIFSFSPVSAKTNCANGRFTFFATSCFNDQVDIRYDDVGTEEMKNDRSQRIVIRNSIKLSPTEMQSFFFFNSVPLF